MLLAFVFSSTPTALTALILLIVLIVLTAATVLVPQFPVICSLLSAFCYLPFCALLSALCPLLSFWGACFLLSAVCFPRSTLSRNMVETLHTLTLCSVCSLLSIFSCLLSFACDMYYCLRLQMTYFTTCTHLSELGIKNIHGLAAWSSFHPFLPTALIMEFTNSLQGPTN